MRRIFTPCSTTDRICAQQKYDPQASYRRTSHCLEIPCDDGALLYHTLTGALFLIEHHETANENEEELVKNRFLVPEGFDDNQYALEVRRILSLLRPRSDSKTSFTILTTTDCNARCFYCYELGCKKLTMTASVARDTADYIARVCKGKKVRLNWFGGEPLYNVQAIDVICERLAALHIDYASSIVSNGYLFDKATAEKAADLWRLERAQITIDGTKDRYQKTKAYIYHDENAYERVLQNIRNLTDRRIDVNIRLNMNRENADDLLALCDELAERFKDSRRLSVYPMLLKAFVGKVGEFETDDEAVRHYLILKNKLSDLGLLKAPVLERSLNHQRCMADNDDCEVIDPDGSIGKCEHFDEADRIGTIYTDERDQALIAAWKEQVVEEKCRTCPLFPRCIELKKCSWAKDGCSDAVRDIRIIKLKEAVSNAYIKEKEPT